MTNEQIIKENMGLIYKISNNFYGVDKEDLIQAGALGVVKAYKNYKENSEAKFSTYAVSSIFGEMCRLANQKQIKISKDILRFHKVIETTRYELAQRWHRFPTNEEIALFLERDVSEIEETIYAASIIVSSLDQGTNEDRSIYETIPTEENVSIDDKLLIDECMECLSEDERKIIEYRYFEGMTQSEVARKLKKTQVMISRYEKKGIDKMHEHYVA